MKIRCLRHVPFEDAGAIEDWAVHRGFPLCYTCLDENEGLPRTESFDFLVVLGGPMNIYEEEQYPWLAEEKQFLKECVRARKKILGICLGAQLLADVLGGKVSGNPFKEIGWHPVHLSRSAEQSPVLLRIFPKRFTAFQWHGDTFHIPPGGLRWAESSACQNQAFQYGQNIIGLQFHLEYTRKNIENMLYYCSDEIIDSPFIQKPSIIRKGYDYLPQMNAMLFRFLDEWLAQSPVPS
ncbi:MAG TPA: type 1 glutamine amidotransferase [Anaerohalosphaeraceae bacterium]|nr:type 1 glutamine amidotransferase [Anaerohalosphaeraceae bacterium]HOL89032.1 type 1 glutamine amidotransferase [Anaerohalosphaeraceae bacterium]HPP56934.1 type 1 glutamine amidotransferase [Anaerohalosphaeraceae bacterium]